MGQPVVHFEMIGTDPDGLRAYYRALFGWHSQPAPVAPGGVGGGAGFAPHALFYVGVPDVEDALTTAEALGGRRILGPVANEAGGVVVGHFTDPEGNLVGFAGPR